MSRLRFPVVVLALLLGTAAWAGNLEDCGNDYPDLSIARCTAIIDAGSDQTTIANAYYNRGMSYDKLGQHDRAIKDFDRAIALNPNGAKIYNSRGLAYQDTGQPDLAIEDFDHAIALNPGDATAYNNRGRAHNEKGQPNRAIEDFDHAIALNPSVAAYYYNRGLAYDQKGQNDRALEDYSRAIVLNPIFAEAYKSRSFVYELKGQPDRANQDYDRAITLNPNLATAHRNHDKVNTGKGAQQSSQTYEDGLTAARRGYYGDAIEILLPLAEGGDSAAQLVLGQIYYKNVRYDDDVREAEKWFRLAAEKGVAQAQFALGVIYNNRWATYPREDYLTEEEFYSEAVRLYQLAAEQEFAPAQAALANLLILKKSTRSQGAQWYLRAASHGYFDAYVSLSNLYESGRGVEKNLTEALRWARLAADAGHVGGYRRLAHMYEKGVGVPRDNIQAYMWHDLASQTDKSEATIRDSLARRMTQEQIAEAQRLAREWMANHP